MDYLLRLNILYFDTIYLIRFCNLNRANNIPDRLVSEHIDYCLHRNTGCYGSHYQYRNSKSRRDSCCPAVNRLTLKAGQTELPGNQLN